MQYNDGKVGRNENGKGSGEEWNHANCDPNEDDSNVKGECK